MAFNRREMMKGSVTFGLLYFVTRALAAVGIGAGTVLMTACPFNTGTLISWTVEIVNALQRMQPILTSLGVPNLVKLVADAVIIANDLKAAFANNQSTDFVTLFDKLSATLDQIANDLGLLSITFRVQLEAILALASIALHLIADHLKKTVVAVPAAQSEVHKQAARDPRLQRAIKTIEARADEQPWGLVFKH